MTSVKGGRDLPKHVTGVTASFLGGGVQPYVTTWVALRVRACACACAGGGGGVPYYRERPAWVQGWALSGGGPVPGGCHQDCTGLP